MAEIDGMFILRRSGRPKSGAAFGLGGVSRLTALEKLGGGWEVEVRDGSRIVVARGGSASTYEDARDEALRMANAGLDLLSMKGSADLGIADAVDSHIVWWPSDQGTVLRVSSVATFTASLDATVTATDAQGNVVPPPRQRRHKWDESFTYFRRAQLTDDLFEAFRNICLALESLLSRIAAPKPAEREHDWLNRALSVVHAHVVKLDPFAPPGTTNPSRAVGDEIRQARNAVFHAKENQARFMPHDWADRTKVSEALAGMVRLYLRIAETHLQLRRSWSGLFAGGFRMLTNHLDSALVIHVTDDTTPFDPDQSTINPRGGRVLSLATRPTPELDQPFVRYFAGRVSLASPSGLTRLTRTVATVDGSPWFVSVVDGRLTLSGIDWFEAQMGIRATNKGVPRAAYAA